MQLFHYTTPVNALLIGMGHKRDGNEGLSPHTVEYGPLGPMQTIGQPVVWLTKEESNICTPEHAAHFERAGVADEHYKVGEPIYGGPVRCEVQIERSRHVMRWTEFMRTTKIEAVDEVTGKRITGRDVLDAYDMPPSLIIGWWVSLKAIPLSRVLVPLTCEQAIEAWNRQIERHPTAEGREQYKQQRDSFAALNYPGTLLVFHNGECQLATRKAA